MLMNLLTKVFGSKNERELKKMQPAVVQINELESEIKALDDAALKRQTARFRERLDNGEPLDDLLPEAFAPVREASFSRISPGVPSARISPPCSPAPGPRSMM